LTGREATDFTRAAYVLTIEYISADSNRDSQHYATAFQRGLSASGYVDGESVTTEYRWAEGIYERLPWLAKELVNRKVGVIAAGGPPATLAAKDATSTIDRGHHRTRDDWSDAAHRHQPLACRIVIGQRRNLVRHAFNALVQGGASHRPAPRQSATCEARAHRCAPPRWLAARRAGNLPLADQGIGSRS
jgi:hypothetical protein